MNNPQVLKNGCVFYEMLVLFFRKGIHQGSLRNRKRIGNVLSSFRTTREAQRTQTRIPSFSTNTVRKST